MVVAQILIATIMWRVQSTHALVASARMWQQILSVTMSFSVTVRKLVMPSMVAKPELQLLATMVTLVPLTPAMKPWIHASLNRLQDALRAIQTPIVIMVVSAMVKKRVMQVVVCQVSNLRAMMGTVVPLISAIKSMMYANLNRIQNAVMS